MTRRAGIVFLGLVAALAGVSAQAPSDLDARVDRELPSLVGTYTSLHAAPELSGHEEKTAAFIAGELRTLGYTVTDHIGKYLDAGMTGFGVAGVLVNGRGPTVLVRTELDALPVSEKTGLPYASAVQTKNADGQVVGVMHACGHDLHMTSFLGTARLLVAMKDRWHGTVIMLAQPAEETGNGADALLRDGLYAKVGQPNYVLALHDSSDLESGIVGYAPGFAMANIDAVDITVRGVGGHGAMPDHTKDPVVLASELVLALQTIVSREISPSDPTVVTVGSIHGGTKRNVIPDEVVLQLTVRTYKKDVREHVLASIQRIAKGLAMAAGVPDDRLPVVAISKTERGDALYNDPALTARLAKVWEGAFGKDRVIRIAPEMVSEDVGHLGLDGKIPVLQFRIGAVAPATLQAHKASGIPLPALHSAVFAPLPEPAIRSGIKATVLAVLDLLGPSQEEHMRIGIVGAGMIGSTVARLWIDAGHDVRLGTRHPEALQTLSKQLGPHASAGTPADAAAFGEIVVVTVPLGAIPEVARDLAPLLAGKIVMDTGNAYEKRDGDAARAATKHPQGSAGWAASMFPNARWIKAFNSVHFKTLETEAHRGGDRVGIPLASDDRVAMETAASLVRDAGFDPVIVGALARGKEFEPGTPPYNTGMSGRELRMILK